MQHHGPALAPPGRHLTLPKLPFPMARRIWKWSKFTVDETEEHQVSWQEGLAPPSAPTAAAPRLPEGQARRRLQAELQLLCKAGRPEPRRGVGPGGCAAPDFLGSLWARPGRPTCRQNGMNGAPQLQSQVPSEALSPGSWSQPTKTHKQEALGLLGLPELQRQTSASC